MPADAEIPAEFAAIIGLPVVWMSIEEVRASDTSEDCAFGSPSLFGLVDTCIDCCKVVAAEGGAGVYMAAGAEAAKRRNTMSTEA